MKASKLGALILTVLTAFSSTAYSADLQVKENDPMVPVRFISEGIGAEVVWDEAADMIIVKNGDSTLRVKIGSSEAQSGNGSVTLKKPVEEKNGRAFVQLSVLNDINGSKLTEDECMRILAAKYLDLMKAGNISDFSMLYSDGLYKTVIPDLAPVLSKSFLNYGDVKVTESEITKNAVHKNIKLNCNTSNMGPLDIVIRFDSNLKIDDQISLPAGNGNGYKAPAYDNRNYQEKEVVVGEGDFKLSGTLTLPKGDGPFPVIILVHGSGTNDSDETVGPLKPFRDIAVGLASKNIAVLRYTKRTNEHNLKSSLVPKFDVYDETIDDAVSAVKAVSQLDKVDKSNIFVLGHSQGGLLMPRIVKADKDNLLKGAVIMSGTTRPLSDVMLSQLDYLSKLGLAAPQQYEYYKAQFDLLKNHDFKADKPLAGYSLGTPYWWKDMASYYPVKDALDITKPMLIMQGERDYQVTAAEDFKGWKDALGDKSNVSFKLYPKLNHIYTEGEGAMSTPLEYNNPANIPQYVIDDLAAWISSKK